LALSNRPVNIRQLLARIAVRHPVNLQIAPNVPERVVTDEHHLAKVVAYFVDDDAEPGIRTLEVRHETVSEEASLVFSLSVRTSPEAMAQSPQQPSGLTRLHLALTQALCALMGGSQTANRLTLPMRTAEDQAHTGIFRLAQLELSEPPAVAEAKADEVAAVESQADDESIDFMYLDRQLGSLAPVILARTAPVFIAEAQRRMTDLHVARESEDLKRLHGIARAWRGSALAVGACKLAALFDAIDKQVALGRLPAPGAIWQVRSVLDRAVRSLELHALANGRRA